MQMTLRRHRPAANRGLYGGSGRERRLAFHPGGRAVEVGTICRRPVFTIRPYERVTRAAQLMGAHEVGYLVVVEFDPYARPVGVLTESDIVVRVLARGLDPKAVCVREVMTADPTLVREADFVEAALLKMREAGVGRLP